MLKDWLYLYAVLIGYEVLISLIKREIISGLYPFLNFLITWLLLTAVNIFLIWLQCKCIKRAEVIDSAQAEEVDTQDKLEKRNRVLAILTMVIVCVVIIVSIVAGVIAKATEEHREKSIADVNGADNYALNTITVEDILSNEHSPTKMWFGETSEGEQSGITDKKLKDYDYDYRSFSAKTFSGVDILQATLADSDNFELDITSEVASGNFIVAVIVDGEFYCQIDANVSEKVSLVDVRGKTVLVKFAGESAECRVCVERTKTGDASKPLMK